MTLKEARDLAGLSQPKLAKLAGLDQSTIYDLEAGRNKKPSHDVVVRITRALQRLGLVGITAEQLFPVPERPATTETDDEAVNA